MPTRTQALLCAGNNCSEGRGLQVSRGRDRRKYWTAEKAGVLTSDNFRRKKSMDILWH